MKTPQRNLKEIQRLLAAFPPISGEPALVLHNYLTAIDGFDTDLVTEGVDLVLRGALPGHDGRFAPTAPMLAAACRMAAEKRARDQYIAGLTAPRLPAPEIVKTPEQRERAKAMAREFAASQSPSRIDQHADDQAKRDRLAKHDSFFADEFVPVEGGVGRISKTLAKKLGYSAGAPESDREAS